MVKKSNILQIGDKFNNLTIIKLEKEHIHIYPSGQKQNIQYYLCKCDCGKNTIVDKTSIYYNRTKSCGCKRGYYLKKSRGFNGLRGNPIYENWHSMKQRILNIKHQSYRNYGGRGITICDEWLTYKEGLPNFINWAINNNYQENLSIDRIDNNGNYEPSNCRWVDMKTQCRNTRTNRLITYNNETHCVAEWAEIFNIKYSTLMERIKRGWDIEKCFKEKAKYEKKL